MEFVEKYKYAVLKNKDEDEFEKMCCASSLCIAQ